VPRRLKDIVGTKIMDQKTILQLSALGLVVLVTLIVMIPIELKSRRLLNAYWTRSCMGKEWLNYFPGIPKESIRAFLAIFVEAFLFNSKRKLKFKPNDKIMDIYYALYPEKGWADALELEYFAKNLKKKYNVDLYSVKNENITLGEIFEMTIKASQQWRRGDRG
jgi:hypothetical protein